MWAVECGLWFAISVRVWVQMRASDPRSQERDQRLCEARSDVAVHCCGVDFTASTARFVGWIASLRSQIRQIVTEQTPHQWFQQRVHVQSRDPARRHWLGKGAVRTREPAG